MIPRWLHGGDVPEDWVPPLAAMDPDFVKRLGAQVRPGVWHVKGCSCPQCAGIRAAVREMTGRDKHLAKVMNVNQAAKQAVAGEPGFPPEAADPEPDPVAQWWEVTRSAILPGEGKLPQWRPFPPGTCAECGHGPLHARNRCWYCARLEDLALEKQQETPRRQDNGPAVIGGMALAGVVVLIASVVMDLAGLLVLGLALLTVAVMMAVSK
jgi:hypothetical protein